MTNKKVGSGNKSGGKVATDGFNVDVLADKLAKLRALVPEAFVEGKLDPALLGKIFKKDSVTLEKGAPVLAGSETGEQYGLNWAGKRFVYDEIAKQSVCTLTLDQKRSIPKQTIGKEKVESENVFIEGENLEVLRTLQKAYYNKIKMIYIDPPYNTGKDFVYHDNFRQTEDEYYCDECNIAAAGHLAKAFKLNSRDGGRFHSNWLNMIYPRLFLARNLLRDDGVIFVSIDDNEVHNLRMVMNDIFGEENFQGQIHWRRRHNQPNDPNKMLALVAEHILVFSKNSESLKESGVGKIELTGNFSNPDNDKRGDWNSKPWKVGSNQNGSKYTIKLPSGREVNGEWMGEEKTYLSLLNDGRIYFPKNGDGAPRKKIFKSEREEDGQVATNWFEHTLFGNNQEATAELSDLFDDVKNLFDNPKPTKLLTKLTQLGNLKNNDIILDFFAGSGTTAHAVMAQNIADGGNRTYICVQMPEETPEGSEARKAGYERISEIAIERIKRAGVKLKEENPSFAGDLGVRVYQATDSHFPQWRAKAFENNEELEQAMIDYTNSTATGTPRQRADEVLLKLGYPLTTPLEDKGGWYLAGETLALVLDEKFKAKDLMQVFTVKPTTVIVLEQIFKKDEEKINFDLRCKERKVIFETI